MCSFSFVVLRDLAVDALSIEPSKASGVVGKKRLSELILG
jgi:hypothetical protein